MHSVPGRDPEARKEANRANERAKVVGRHLRELEERVHRMALASQALWELLREETGLTDEQVRDRVAELQERRRTVDGRFAEPAVECARCSRPTRRSRGACLYCGAPLPADDGQGPIFS